MHTIMKFPFTKGMFSIDDSIVDDIDSYENDNGETMFAEVVNNLNILRDGWFIMDSGEKLNDINKDYYAKRKKLIWRSIIQLLPSSYMQKRTWTGNYSILRQICRQREGHRLTEWHEFREKMRKLPYANELIFYKGDK